MLEPPRFARVRPRRSRSSGASAELETLRALIPRAQGEGRRVVLLGGEPGSGKSRLVREFAAEASAEGVLVLYGACDAVVRTPYGPFVEALDRLARVDRARGAARARSAPAAASSPGCSPTCRPGSALCRPGRGRSRTPSATASTRRSPICSPGVSRRTAGAAGDRGRALGGRPDAAAPPPPRARRRQRPHAGVATFRDTEAELPPSSPRRSPTCADPTTSSGCGSAGLSRRGGDGVRAPRGRADPGAGPAELAQDDQRPHRGQPVPRLRAVAGAGRDQGRRGGRRRDPAHPAAGRARHPRERSRGGQPAPRPSGARGRRPARARRHRRGGVRARRPPPRRRPRRSPSCSPPSTRRSAAG